MAVSREIYFLEPSNSYVTAIGMSSEVIHIREINKSVCAGGDNRAGK